MVAEKRTKRRVKDPETFRERALKATGSSDKPQSGHRAGRFIRRLFSSIFAPIGRGLGFIFYRQPFLILRRPLRLLGKILLLPYLKNSWQELRQVTWPSWQQSRQLTIAVILFAAVFGAAIAGVDWGLDKIFKHILLK